MLCKKTGVSKDLTLKTPLPFCYLIKAHSLYRASVEWGNGGGGKMNTASLSVLLKDAVAFCDYIIHPRGWFVNRFFRKKFPKTSIWQLI